MKQFLIATAALSLIGGAAFAQTSSTMPDASQTAMSPAATPAPAAAPMTDSSMTPTAPAADMSSTTTTSTTTVAANTPSGSPPATYPICTSKHEDRCVNRYQATRMASTSHMKKTRHAMTTTETTTTGEQPAASPST